MTEKKKPKREKFYIARKVEKEFEQLKKIGSPFANTSNHDLFLAALVVGYHEKCRLEFGSKRKEFFWEKDLDNSEKSLLKAIAISEEGLEVLLDKDRVYSIAEEYASGGVSSLKIKVFSGEYGSYAKRLESELLRECEKIANTKPEVEKNALELSKMSIDELLVNEESYTLEFKETMSWDVAKKQPSKTMKKAVARTVAAFMNSEGGVLLIGVDNNKNVHGLKRDLSLVKEGSVDQFCLAFTAIIKDYIGKANWSFVKMEIVQKEDKQIAVVSVKASPRPVYLNPPGEKQEFCNRGGNSTQCLEIREANQYVRDHWPNLS